MTRVPITDIRSNPANPRVLRDSKFAALKKSIEKFPEMLEKRPLVVVTGDGGKYVVLGGNARFRACQELGMRDVPVIIADDWSEEQRREFVVRDNVSAGDWDFDHLQAEWETSELADFGIDGFMDEEPKEKKGVTTKRVGKSADDYSAFELVMQHENKMVLIETLNHIKRVKEYDKVEDAMMELVRVFKNQ